MWIVFIKHSFLVFLLRVASCTVSFFFLGIDPSTVTIDVARICCRACHPVQRSPARMPSGASDPGELPKYKMIQNMAPESLSLRFAKDVKNSESGDLAISGNIW